MAALVCIISSWVFNDAWRSALDFENDVCRATNCTFRPASSSSTRALIVVRCKYFLLRVVNESMLSFNSASILSIVSSPRHLATSASANSLVSDALVSFVDLICVSNVSNRRFEASNKLSNSSRNISNRKICSLLALSFAKDKDTWSSSAAACFNEPISAARTYCSLAASNSTIRCCKTARSLRLADSDSIASLVMA